MGTTHTAGQLLRDDLAVAAAEDCAAASKAQSHVQLSCLHGLLLQSASTS